MRLVKKAWILYVLIIIALFVGTFFYVDFLRKARLEKDTLMVQKAMLTVQVANNAKDKALEEKVQGLTSQVSELQKKLDDANSKVSKMQESLKALGVARDFQ